MRWPAPLEVLLVLNVGVFLMWAFGSARRMTRHFEVSPSSLARRPWTLLTATVSHSDLYSLVGNLQARFPSFLPRVHMECSPYNEREIGHQPHCSSPEALSQS